eukprot:5975324-Amphidinium_carterae.1
MFGGNFVKYMFPFALIHRTFALGCVGSVLFVVRSRHAFDSHRCFGTMVRFATVGYEKDCGRASGKFGNGCARPHYLASASLVLQFAGPRSLQESAYQPPQPVGK